MSRYIDADKIDWRLIIPTNVTIAEENMIHCAKRLIERQPTVDVVEVVRCKDCKWWEREAEDSPMGYCHACKHGHYSRHWEIHIIRTYEEDFFCADAEPKEEEEE